MDNLVYTYNNNFINLLTLIDELINKNIKPYNIKSNGYNPNLLEEIVNLNLFDNSNVINKIKRLNSDLLKVMYYVYLSNDDNKELIIYYLFLNSYKYKEKLLNMRNLNCVSASLKISNYVSREAHKYKGFVRFKELNNGVLYAEIEPTNNILSIISKHFKNRLSNFYWIIKDNKREIISIYDKKNYYIIDSKRLLIDLEIDNNDYEDLWCTFYETIGIKERKNDKCRMNFMPKKYWKYIIEVSDNIEKSS
ncbi:MAG: DNA metabolism protein [Firmicutes bacterium]|nr:DNA metabolism protein [Bacillota bacterium]